MCKNCIGLSASGCNAGNADGHSGMPPLDAGYNQETLLLNLITSFISRDKT